MSRKIIPYQPHLKELARKLRNNSTYTEVLLWKRLSGKQMMGYDFHRQKPLLNYIVDFYCNELNLAIEIDGATHFDNDTVLNDKKRDEELAKYGVTVLRIWDGDVLNNIENVLNTIEQWIVDFEHDNA